MGRVLCLPAVVLTVTFIVEATEPALLFVVMYSVGILDGGHDLPCGIGAGTDRRGKSI